MLIITSVIFGSLVALAALICGTILLIVKMRGNNNPAGGTDREEARIIQEIYQGLDSMEKRIESLEVILSESRKKGAEAGHNEERKQGEENE